MKWLSTCRTQYRLSPPIVCSLDGTHVGRANIIRDVLARSRPKVAMLQPASRCNNRNVSRERDEWIESVAKTREVVHAWPEQRIRNRPSETDLSNPDFASLAQAFGAHAFTITNAAQATEVVAEAMSA